MKQTFIESVKSGDVEEVRLALSNAQYLAVEKDTTVIILQVQNISAFVKCNIHAFDPFDCDSPALFRRRQGAESGWG